MVAGLLRLGAKVHQANVPAWRWQPPCLCARPSCPSGCCMCMPACLQGKCQKRACNRGKACCGNVLMQDSRGNHQVTARWDA